MNGPILAKEGWLFVVIVFVAALLATWWWGVWSWPLWGLLIFVVQFFRDPPRIPPTGDDNILSPADGRIVAVINTQDPWLERPALKISVFMNVFNVHANRSPVTGVVKQKWYHSGKFFNAAMDKASHENERCALWIKRIDGQDVLSVQIAGLIARRILCYAKEGDALQAGGRYGFIRFGSRVDVYMHPSAKAQVAPGEKVKAGLTVLAKLAGS